jgi:predicted NBD/HSP70 family sugar kinase
VSAVELDVAVAAVEVGGSGVETTLFDVTGGVIGTCDHAVRPRGAVLAIAVPGLVADGRVLFASNLGWADVDPAEELGLDGAAAVVVNDAHAAALGEAALHGVDDLLFLGLGTGVGGVLVRSRSVVVDELGHGPRPDPFSARSCPCGRVGCLETVAAGWALPPSLTAADLEVVAGHLGRLVTALADASTLVVVAGGMTRRHPALVELVGRASGRTVVGTAAPASAKSAAPWGLLTALEEGRAAT